LKYKVATVARSSPDATCNIDVLDWKALEKLVATVRPSMVINAIKPGMSTDQMEKERELAQKANAGLVVRLVGLQPEYGYKILHLSTDWLYEGLEGVEYTEESPLGPKNYYSQTKLEAEQFLMRQEDGNWLSLRTEGLFGFDLAGRNILMRLKNSDKMQLAADQFSQPISAHELACIALKLAQKDARGIYNVVGKDYLSRLEFGKRACKFFGFGTRLGELESTERAIKIPQFLRVSTAKVEAQVGPIKSLDWQFEDLAKELEGRI